MSKPHLSISQLSMLARCGQQYFYRYVQGIKSPPGVALVIGKGTHKAVERDLSNKIEWGELLEADAIKDLAAEETKRLWQREAPQLNDGDPDEGGAVDMAVSLASLHHAELAPTIAPLAVERAFRLELDGYPYDLEGVIDIEEAGAIRDTKTTAKAPQSDAAATSDQLTAYHMEATARGHADKLVKLDYLVKTKVAKVVTLESTRTSADHARLLARMESAARVIESGAFMPTTPDNWACSPKWCGYWDRCPHGARQAATVGLVDVSRLRSKPSEIRR